MRGLHWILAAGLTGIVMQSGCSSVDKTPPPPRIAVPPADDGRMAAVEPVEPRPLPPQAPPDAYPPPPFDDVPLVTQHPPEERAFVDAYNHVGKPRIVLFVNRTLEGEMMPVNQPDPIVSVEHRTDKSRETTDVYLHPGQYDDVQAHSIDYGAVETILTDWLSADGHVSIISPTMARQRLTADQIKDIQNGRPRVLSEVARQLDADVLVQVQAHPTRQTDRGLQVRIIAEAINIKGGESIARAVVDVDPPLDKLQINKYTRFLARKLMDGMTASWDSYGPPPSSARPPEETPVPAPAPPPTPTPAPAPTPVPPATVPNPLAPPPSPGAAAVTPAPETQPTIIEITPDGRAVEVPATNPTGAAASR